jgi:hypothetical protein
MDECMDITISNYLKIFEYFHEDEFCVGNGILVEHYLVTAAHVAISAGRLNFTHEGKQYHLDLENAIFIKDIKTQEEICDLAIFDIGENLSPLCFADDIPAVSNEYQSISFRPSDRKLISCHVVLDSIVHKAMLCKTDVELREGSSGSPLILNGKVYGILIGGFPNEDKYMILYQPLHEINKFLQLTF